MAYLVREIFPTLQGEGAQAGLPMVYVRFAGCNLWSGHEADRERDAARTGADCPRYCDTDFVTGDKLTTEALLARVASHPGPRWICFTGGEPALQIDRPLLEAVRTAGYRAAIETNGTRPLAAISDLIDWICVSPKLHTLAVTAGHELKLIYRGQPEAELVAYQSLAFEHLSLQPEWGLRYPEHLAAALAFLRRQPRWRLSLQTHKILGLP